MLDPLIREDEAARIVYSVDASIYEILPQAISTPRSVEDIVQTLQFAKQRGLSVTARGAATGTTGGCLGNGVIIDCSYHMNRILEINPAEHYAICEPGVVQDDLNHALTPFGLRLGPNTSTGNRATIGGMIANNAAGSHSLLYGEMRDVLLEIELVLASGEVINLKPSDISSEWILQGLYKIKERYQSLIQKEFPRLHRRSSGYNLDALTDSRFNPCELIAGSEGTLGIISKVKLSLAPVRPFHALYILPYSDLMEGLKAVPSLLQYHPDAIELIDNEIIKRGRLSPTLAGRLDWLKGDPACLLVVELGGETEEELKEKCFPFSPLDPAQEKDVWALRQAGLELLLSRRSFQRATAFLEDVAVPPEHLPSFIAKYQALLHEGGKEASFYGHVSSGCIHIRPFIDLRDEDDITLMRTLMEKTVSLLKDYQGVLSSEHGDGLIRSWLNEKLFGKPLTNAMEEVKFLFDPQSLLNPGKKVFPRAPFSSLRFDSKTKWKLFSTFQNFSKEGGFALAVEMCNGNGLCRKKETLMCPSFQATQNEMDSTRARAQVLRSLIQGRLTPQSLAHPSLHEVLDLCLECKGCKKECPSQVDMAKMKAEALYQLHQVQKPSLRTRLMGHVASFLSIGSQFPSLANWFSSFSFLKNLIGIDTSRSLPHLAKESFSSWMQGHYQPPSTQQVLLFIDTYTEFCQPSIGMGAVKVLNHMGFLVHTIPWSCCGRPLISKGFLAEAKEKAEVLLQKLPPHLPVIGLEPSCILTIRDDFPSLTSLPIPKTYTFDEFISLHLDKLSVAPSHEEILLHGHCHEKALVGMEPTLHILRSLPGSTCKEIPSGCCGMAGSFGYEKEHASLSQRIGELILFPTIRSNPHTTLIASGFSCRSQIAHHTKGRPLHLAEYLSTRLRSI